MFKGFKKVVKGGLSTVGEQGSNLAGKVVGDSIDLKDKLTDGAKKTLQGSVQLVAEGTEKVQESNAAEYKEKTKEVAHKVKHYGAFGEEYLGYSDPSKDLRKAVKAKEKAAKKAKKAKKKKGIKEEDLFAPENLEKYKREIEERRKQAVSPAVESVGEQDEEKENEDTKETKKDLKLDLDQSYPTAWSNEASPDFGTPEEVKPASEDKPAGSPGRSSREDADDDDDDDDGWKKFQALTSGVDKVLKEKQSKLEEIKVDSYYQRKKTQVEILEDSKVARPTTLVGKRKKKWVDLDEEGFEEKEGVVCEEVSDTEETEDEAERALDQEEEAKEVVEEESKNEEEKEVKAAEEEEEDKPEGYVDVPEDEPIDLDAEDELFNTGFVDAIVSGDIKLAVIPDSPEPAEDEDDPFDTKFAQDIVTKHEKDRKVREKVESNKIKFGCIAAAADVLSGKSEKVDKSAIEHTVKKKRRRANRINLIAEEADDVTAREEIDGVSPEKNVDDTLDIFAVGEELQAPTGDILASTPSPGVAVQQEENQEESPEKKHKLSEDLKEFDVVQVEAVNLTSNVAILAAEFTEAQEEEADPFDEAFDQLAKESISKSALEDIEKDLFDTDLFDTTKADEVLQLASLTTVVKKDSPEDNQEFDLDDDRDPFDTSAFDHITKDYEEDLEFEALAHRDPHETVGGTCEVGPDPFDVVEQQLTQQTTDEDWAAFGEVKPRPSRPPPPRPAPPRPAPPKPAAPKVEIDYASGRNTPSVIVKAPSSESIKSWNVAQAENLIRKSNIEAIEASVLEQEGEFDPFDTTEYNDVVAELKAKESDPFDTSALGDTGPSKTELKLIEGEILENTGTDSLGNKSNVDILNELDKSAEDDSVDPFDTDFAAEVLPDKGDPFDTTHINPKQAELEEDPEYDPFDTTAADKVIPVRKPKVSQRSTVSIEDEDFDPETSFNVKKARRPPPPPRPGLPNQVIDPFSAGSNTNISAKLLTPVTENTAAPEKEVVDNKDKNGGLKDLENEFLDDIGGPLKRSFTDDDFDPRAASSPEPEPEPEEDDPFDTSFVV